MLDWSVCGVGGHGRRVWSARRGVVCVCVCVHCVGKINQSLCNMLLIRAQATCSRLTGQWTHSRLLQYSQSAPDLTPSVVSKFIKQTGSYTAERINKM